ncbi:MAG: gliding motility protein GldN [Leadbetterella sp.]
MKRLALISVLSLGVASATLAQEKSDNGINPLSLRPVHESNVMKRMTIWRRVDLDEKQNAPMFSKGSEITKHLIEGVKAGVLEPYADDSLTTKITLEEFTKRLTAPDASGGGLSEEEKAAGFGDATSGGDDGWGGGGSTTAAATPTSQASAPVAQSSGGAEFYPSELNIMEIKEDWLFDKQRSRQYYDIQSVTIKIPAELSGDGLEKVLASFRYKELDSYFKLNPNCIWYNAANTAQHKNLADAFELRLFHGRIIRMSNARGKFLDEIYKNPKEALIKSSQLEQELLEFENNMWEN